MGRGRWGERREQIVGVRIERGYRGSEHGADAPEDQNRKADDHGARAESGLHAFTRQAANGLGVLPGQLEAGPVRSVGHVRPARSRGLSAALNRSASTEASA